MFGDDYSPPFQYKMVMILFKHFKILRCPRITPPSFFWWGNKWTLYFVHIAKHIDLTLVFIRWMSFCYGCLAFYYLRPCYINTFKLHKRCLLNFVL